MHAGNEDEQAASLLRHDGRSAPAPGLFRRSPFVRPFLNCYNER